MWRTKRENNPDIGAQTKLIKAIKIPNNWNKLSVGSTIKNDLPTTICFAFIIRINQLVLYSIVWMSRDCCEFWLWKKLYELKTSTDYVTVLFLKPVGRPHGHYPTRIYLFFLIFISYDLSPHTLFIRVPLAHATFIIIMARRGTKGLLRLGPCLHTNFCFSTGWKRSGSSRRLNIALKFDVHVKFRGFFFVWMSMRVTIVWKLSLLVNFLINLINHLAHMAE